MDIIVQTINTAGRAFVEFALPMLLQSSLLIAILLAVDAVLRTRVRAVFRYWIWMLVLVKLVLPPSLGSPVSLGTWFGGKLEVAATALYEAEPLPPPETPVIDPPVTGLITPVPSLPIPTDIETPTIDTAVSLDRPPVVPLNWQGLVLLGWAAVVTALLLLLVQRVFFVRGLAAQAEEADRTMRDALDRCRQRLGPRGPISLRLSPNATSPAVCGLVRPVVLIPQGLAARLHGTDLEAVLLHELAHVQRGDLWISLAQTLLQILYFYHPLLWLANAVIRRIREQAVDETVLVAMGETAQQYPETLVNIAKLALRRRPTLSLRLVGVVESKSALAGRIKHILTRPIPTTARLGIAGLTVVLLTAVLLLPMARAQQVKVPAGTLQTSPGEPAAPASTDQGTGGGALAEPGQAAAKLPNGVTVRLLAYAQLTGQGLKWWTPAGEAATVPGVYEADVEGLGTVLAFQVDPPQTGILSARLYRGDSDEPFKTQWRPGNGGTWLFAMGNERSYANILVTAQVMDPPVVGLIPLTGADQGKVVEVGQFGIAQIADLQVISPGQGESEEGAEAQPPIIQFAVVKSLGSYPNIAAVQDQEGHTHTLSKESDKLGTAIYTARLRPEQLAALVVEAAPVREASVRFRNLSLTPARPTTVQMEVDAKPKVTWQSSKDSLLLGALVEALERYQQEHNGRLPVSLQGMQGYLPRDPWLLEQLVYVARSSLLPKNAEPVLVAYDKALLPQGKGTYVVFATINGSYVQFLSPGQLAELGIPADGARPPAGPSAGGRSASASGGAAARLPESVTADTDGDGLSDFQEVHKYLTDPTKKDSDDDGTPDGDWAERREYAYSVRTVLRYLPPFDEDGLNDDLQDGRVLKRTPEYIEVEVIHYPLATGYDAVSENPNWRRDDARLAEYLAPGATTNWDEQMKRDLLAALKADGIDVETLTDKRVVEQVSSWLLKRSRSLDNVFTTYYVDFPAGKPQVYPGLEDAFRHEFERDSRNYDWTLEQHFDHELLGKGMFYNKTHGSCTSTAVYLTTVLRALGIPTRMILATPTVDASDRTQILMVKNAITHNQVRLTMLAGLGRSSHGWTNHTFNEVYVGNRWCRLDYNQLGCPAFGLGRFGLQTHLYTFNDLSDVNFAPTWGRRYAKGEHSDTFQHDNPYSAVEVSELFGPHGKIPNPPYTARDLAPHPQPDIYLYYPARVNVWTEFVQLVEGGTFNKTGRPHQKEFYDNLFDGIWLTRPQDILVLLFALDTPERIPAGYEDLLPKPWPEIEAALKQGETVELSGKARDLNVILLAAPVSDALMPLVQNSKLLQTLGKGGAPAASAPVKIVQPSTSAGAAAKPDGGATVELLGVCTHPSEGKQWWRPAGTPLAQAPYKTTGATETLQAGLQWYEFALRLVAPDDAHVRWVVAGSTHGSDSGPPLGHAGEYRRDLRANKATLPAGREATDIRLGVAVGAWQTRVTHATLKHEGSYTLDEGRAIAFGVAYEKDGSTYLPITTNFTGEQADYEVVAVDGQDTTHHAAGSRGSGHVLLSLTYRFDLPLERVKEFRLQTRPWTWFEFKDVSLRPGQGKGGVPAVSGSTQGVRRASSIKMVVTLAGGVTLELLGICEHPSEGKQWWWPDGSPLEQAPYKTTGSKLEPQAGHKDYEFVARYGGAPDIDLLWDVPGSGRASTTGSPLDESGRYVRDLAVDIVQFSEDQTATPVRIAVAAGAWETQATHPALEREGTYGVKGGKAVAFGIAYTKDGRTFVPVTTDLFRSEVAFRVVAIRQQGEVCSGGLSGWGGDKLDSLTYRFNCPLSDVKEFQFQTRPWTWVEFPNVALRPVQK